MTTCIAQVVELHAALEKIKEDSGRWNKRLAKLRMEQEAARATAAPQNFPRHVNDRRGASCKNRAQIEGPSTTQSGSSTRPDEPSQS